MGKVIQLTQQLGWHVMGMIHYVLRQIWLTLLTLLGMVSNFFEGSAAPALNNTIAILRGGNSCGDTDDNSADFTTGTPNPRNSAVVLTCADAISTATEAVNLTGAATSNLTGTAIDLTNTAAVANLTATAFALTNVPTLGVVISEFRTGRSKWSR